jgi:hypothetical protein
MGKQPLDAPVWSPLAPAPDGANVRAFEGRPLYDDLGIEYRDHTDDQVIVDAAHATARYEVGVEDGAASV